MGNIKTLKHFTKDRQPTKEQRKKQAKTRTENAKKKRELSDLLSIALKGKIEKGINSVLFLEMGIKAGTIEEALHFVQIAKALSQKDTTAYMALMQTAGLNKPIKIENTIPIVPTIITLSDGTKITL